MQNLNEAINDLRATLAADGFAPGAVEEVAEDWGLNPVLLTRKFREKFNCKPSAYQPPAAVEIKLDYERLYDEGMARAWQSHPKMYWTWLTDDEKEQVKAYFLRNLRDVEKLHLIWK